jgi:hypothetical protein
MAGGYKISYLRNNYIKWFTVYQNFAKIDVIIKKSGIELAG